MLFFSFTYIGTVYPYALVRWFIPVGHKPCQTTGLWMVEPDLEPNGWWATSVIHLVLALQGAHLIPVYGKDFVP
jgi:hypothetical protein